MKKKLLLLGLMAALSTVGYAVDDTTSRLDAHDVAISTAQGEINHLYEQKDKHQAQLDKHEAALADKIGRTEFDGVLGALEGVNTEFENVNSQLDQKADKNAIEGLRQEIDNAAIGRGELSDAIADNKAEIEGVKGEVEGVKGQVADIKGELAGKVDQKDFEDLKNQANGNSQALGELAQDVITNRDNIAANKAEIEKLDKENKEQDGKINNVSQRLEGFKDEVHGALAQQNTNIANNAADIETNKQAIADNKAEIDKNKQDIAANKAEQDKINKENEKVNAEQDKVIAGKLDKEEYKANMDEFNNKMSSYGTRLDNLENKVDNLDEKFNKGLSLMAAMNAVDFQNVSEGEMAIGAGFGHYGNAQSVAVGVAYAPTQNLNLNLKYSVTAGDLDSFAVGAGASYKFRVK